MNTRVRTLLAQIGSFLLAGVLLYLALRGVDLNEIVTSLEHADFRLVPVLIVVVLLSHLLRAWRWTILLEALPERSAENPVKKVSVWTAFASVMIGYMVNYAAPRIGEVARTANLSSRERIQFSSVFGTVVVERILDVIVLLLALASVGLIFLDRLTSVNDLFFKPAVEQLGSVPVLGLAALILGIVVLVFFIFRRVLRRESALHTIWLRRVQPVMTSFKAGVLTLLRTKRRFALVISTIAIWFCYLLMAHLPLEILGMTRTFHLTLLDSWGIMIFGAVGIAIPSPGGTGSYHYITRETLTHLFGVDPTAAATYAILTHGAQLILYVIVGFICILAQGTGFRSIRTTAPTSKPEAGSEAETTPRELSEVAASGDAARN
ncbi:MAG TPA: lysylphosphatidylglycerol synthase transmembrane domain-containing protein [Rhodothermales bacterium]|nr:lysylphosphatidylglycerol synthase transmembrane domain-containing protein [Rhodothermales bacterium]